MAAEWRSLQIDDVADVKHGFAFSGEFFHDAPPGDLLITPGNFRIGGGFKSEKLKYYRGEVPDDFVLSASDLLVTMTDLSKAADTLGFPAFVPDHNPPPRYLHNQRIGKVLIKPDIEVDVRFLYYLLCTREYRNEVLASATGTTVKHTSPSRIGRFQFQLPPLNEQRAIAHALGTLDEKIELDRKMNETLEATVRALFKSWFVDFDPVRARAEGRDPGLPPKIATLFPDSLENSELGEIPRGWRLGGFGEVAENPRRGIAPDAIPEQTAYIALEHIPRECIALSEWVRADGVESGKFAFKKGEILFGKLRPYFHKVGVAPVDGVCSTDILVIAPKTPEWFGFVLGHASSREFVQHTNASSTGTKMPRTNWGDMARYAVVIPTKPIAELFTQEIIPMVSRIVGSIYESRSLASTRDALLPKLISGQLRLGSQHEESIAETCDAR